MPLLVDYYSVHDPVSGTISFAPHSASEKSDILTGSWSNITRQISLSEKDEEVTPEVEQRQRNAERLTYILLIPIVLIIIIIGLVFAFPFNEFAAGVGICLVGVAVWYLGNRIVYTFFYAVLDFLFGSGLNPHNSGLIVKQAGGYENAFMFFLLLATAGFWFVIARKLRSLKLKYATKRAEAAAKDNEEITLVASEIQ